MSFQAYYLAFAGLPQRWATTSPEYPVTVTSAALTSGKPRVSRIPADWAAARGWMYACPVCRERQFFVRWRTAMDYATAHARLGHPTYNEL